jgi:hypothetical protein
MLSAAKHFSANVPIDLCVSCELFNGGSNESCGRQIGFQSGVLEEHTLGWQGSRLNDFRVSNKKLTQIRLELVYS